MRNHRPLAVWVIGLTFVLGAGVRAYAKNARTLHVSSDALLNGKQLKEGEYKVQWETHSPSVTVTFLKGKHEMLTANGRWEDRDMVAPGDTIVYDTNSDGSMKVLEIRLAGSRKAIVFGESGPQSQVTQPGAQNAKLGTSNAPADEARLARIQFVGKPTVRMPTQNLSSNGQAWAPPLFNFAQPVSLAQDRPAPPRASRW